jgi:hypothetical protein
MSELTSPDDSPTEKNIEISKIYSFIELQDKELSVRSQEIESNGKEMQLYYELAKQNDRSDVEDRKDERVNNQNTLTKVLIFLAFSIVLAIGSLDYALYLGKDEIVTEIIKAIIYIGPSVFGGYFAGLNQGKKQNSDKSDD